MMDRGEGVAEWVRVEGLTDGQMGREWPGG